MNNKFQEIIAIPAIVVPSMSIQEIHIAILEASLEYIKGIIDLETLTVIATKMQYFMGMRGEDSRQIENILSQIGELSDRKKMHTLIDTMLIDSVTNISTQISSQKH